MRNRSKRNRTFAWPKFARSSENLEEARRLIDKAKEIDKYSPEVHRAGRLVASGRRKSS